MTSAATDSRHSYEASIYTFEAKIDSIVIFFRYHEDERLLPEYDPSMSDSVKFVGIDPSHSSKDGSKKEQSTSTYFPEHFLDENDLGDQSNQNQGSMYLATLKLNKVRPEQKGTYKCGPSNTSPASVKLHITDGNI